LPLQKKGWQWVAIRGKWQPIKKLDRLPRPNKTNHFLPFFAPNCHFLPQIATHCHPLPGGVAMGGNPLPFKVRSVKTALSMAPLNTPQQIPAGGLSEAGFPLFRQEKCLTTLFFICEGKKETGM
jgi:hypothetical protein